MRGHVQSVSLQILRDHLGDLDVEGRITNVKKDLKYSKWCGLDSLGSEQGPMCSYSEFIEVETEFFFTNK
jgi:hypothetical protein